MSRDRSGIGYLVDHSIHEVPDRITCREPFRPDRFGALIESLAISADGEVRV